MVRPEMRPQGLILLFALLGLSSASWATVGDQTSASQVIFYFHRSALMMVNANQSVYVYDRADINPPLGDEATVVEFRSEIKQTVEGIPVWVGGASWGSRTAQNDTRVVGPVAFSCWLSSEDWLWVWELSGVGVSVAEVDNKGQVVWGPVYKYKVGIGNMLSSSPKEIQLLVNVDHVFKAGNHILFGVMAGSTKQGWKARAHFGSTTLASHVVVSFAEPVKGF